jgi:hypothetical protein
LLLNLHSAVEVLTDLGDVGLFGGHGRPEEVARVEAELSR